MPPKKEARKARKARKPTTTKKASSGKSTVEAVFEAALNKDYVAPQPVVTPLELAHLIAAMGMHRDTDGPREALALLARCASAIAKQAAAITTFSETYARDVATDSKALAEMGLDPDRRDRNYTLKELVARMPTEPLLVGKIRLRGNDLWNEFRRQTDFRPGDPKENSDGSNDEIFSTADLLLIHRLFSEWREGIARTNQAKGKRNLKSRRKGLIDDFRELEEHSLGGDDSASPYTRKPRNGGPKNS